MKKVELLAPAKNFETAIAAINSGADAIYIGASDFGARINASNTIESIERLVNYAHKFYVRVHVTINTILNNSELKHAVKLIKKLYSIGVDAIIVQDMALIKASIDKQIPSIQLHASTQCNNRTLEKVKFFDKMGISRVILARELSIKQIEEICKNTHCEIETFIHGALCVSYSGQCYMSYANGGRSANRGECAQPCRKKYSLIDEDGKVYFNNKHLLSLKDFNASESIEKLILCGVKSFKIEGRLKDENYVKNVTLYYNNLINNYAERTSSGKVFTNFEPNLNKTFNRLYTDYFLNKRCECYNFLTPKSMGEIIGKVTKIGDNYIEVLTNKKLNAQDGICYEYKNEFLGFKINKLKGSKIYPNKMPTIQIGTALYRNFDSEFEKKLKNSKIKRQIQAQISICKDKITVCDEDNNTAFIELIDCETAQNPQKAKLNLEKQLQKSGESDFYINIINFNTSDIPFIPISKINEIRRKLLDKLMDTRLKNYPKLYQKELKYCDFPDNKLDYRANILNTEAIKFYENSGCKISQNAPEGTKILQKNIELMRCKHCLKYAANICTKTGSKTKQLYLMDEQGRKYPLKFDCKNCEMIVLNP